MGRELWGSRSIGERTERQMESMRSKRKVSKSNPQLTSEKIVVENKVDLCFSTCVRVYDLERHDKLMAFFLPSISHFIQLFGAASILRSALSAGREWKKSQRKIYERETSQEESDICNLLSIKLTDTQAIVIRKEERDLC